MQENLPFFSLLPINLDTAREYAAIRRELSAAGKPIPTNDLWIAALAREHNYPVISQGGHFRHVRGVKQLSW